MITRVSSARRRRCHPRHPMIADLCNEDCSVVVGCLAFRLSDVSIAALHLAARAFGSGRLLLNWGKV